MNNNSLTQKQKEFVIKTSLLFLSEMGSELECRRNILNFMLSANFTDAELDAIETAITGWHNTGEVIYTQPAAEVEPEQE